MDGVSNRVVRTICLGRDERIWLGMDRGRVVCLERGKVRIITPEDGVPKQTIRNMAEDGNGNLWLAFPTCLARVSDGSYQVFEPQDGLPGNRGSFQVAALADGGVAYCYDNQLGLIKHDQLVPILELAGPVNAICVAAAAGIWVSEGNRLRMFRDGKISETIASLPEQATPRVMLEDRSGALWIGTSSDGLFCMMSGRIEKAPTSHREVDRLLEDREGNLWAGTAGGGLNQIRPQVLTLFDRKAGLPTDSARSVCEDAAGRIWVTFNNGQLARYEGDRWIDISRQGMQATCLAAAPDGAVWFGSRQGELHRVTDDQWQSWNRADGLAGNVVRSILVARDGKIWIATESPNRLQCFHDGSFHTIAMPQETPEIRSIRAMTEAADGTIWIGTARVDLLRVARDRLIHEPAAGNMGTISIRSLHATPDGSV